MGASIEDVARLAGVSTATVSRALRGLPSVAPATRQRVLDAVAQLGYVATHSASVLATGRTKTIALVAPYVTRWFFCQVIDGAGEVLNTAGYDVLLCNLPSAETRSRFFDQLPIRTRVDAVLLVCLSLTEPELAALDGLEVPIALVGVANERFPNVRRS